MSFEKSAWRSFCETGKIDDYLNYCEKREQEKYAIDAEDVTNATDNRWNSAVGLQDRR